VNARLVAVALLALAGCDYLTSSFRTNGFSGDPYPILVETTSGGLVVGVEEDARPGVVRTAVLDMLSPITAIDRGPDVAVSTGEATLTIYGATVSGGLLDQPRAELSDKQIVNVHPCDGGTDVCTIGTEAAPRPFDALIGVDAFASDALRIRRATDEIFILPNIAGDDLHRSRSCDAVFPSTFRGGGTLILGGTEISFSNRRIAIDACIAPDPYAETQRQRGSDALFVLSTAIGTSLMNESAYERYRQLDLVAIPELATLPEQVVFLPSGPVAGRATTLPSLALVGNLGSNPRAPCRQVYAHHLLTDHNCARSEDCPCTENETFCSVPAVVEIAPATQIPVLVIPDGNPTLLALRTELRPDRPEVDGILGLDALATLELDVDYANGRLLARCVDRQACGARVTLSDRDSRRFVTGCLGDLPGPIP